MQLRQLIEGVLAVKGRAKIAAESPDKSRHEKSCNR
jgi:hypothetical protein